MSTNHKRLETRYLPEHDTNKISAVWCHFEIIVSKDLNVENTVKQLQNQ